MASKRELIQKLLKGIETGDPEAATVVNEASISSTIHGRAKAVRALPSSLRGWRRPIRVSRSYACSRTVISHLPTMNMTLPGWKWPSKFSGLRMARLSSIGTTSRLSSRPIRPVATCWTARQPSQISTRLRPTGSSSAGSQPGTRGRRFDVLNTYIDDGSDPA